MITGIHHVTAIARDAQQNVDFYAGVLGLRFVKKTVNFDDPGTYHLYYGDGLGRPGTILTFFPWPDARPGRRGMGQVATTLLEIPRGTSAWWRDRLASAMVQVESDGDGSVILFRDPDGLALGLVEGDAPGDGGGSGAVPAAYAIRGVWGIHLWVARLDPTAQLLTETMQFRREDAADGAAFEPATENAFKRVIVTARDVAPSTDLPRGLMGSGVVHHVAFRVPDDEEQLAWREKLLGLGYNVSPVMDRQYFHSIYYREPGGILFELATDPPGFTADEFPAALGTGLKLPPQYEQHRATLEEALPPLRVPTA